MAMSPIYIGMLVGWASILSYSDLVRRVLPNRIVLGGAGLAFVWWWVQGGFMVALEHFGAGVVAGSLLIIPFLARGAGGGDVKMLFAAGLMVGWSNIVELIWFVSLSGVVLVVVMLVLKKADGARLYHYLRCLFDFRYDRKKGGDNLPSKSSERAAVPFGIAIGAGLVVTALASVM